MQHSSIKNSTLIQCIHHSQDASKLLADIKQLAKQRQHRNYSKFNGLWFQGRGWWVKTAQNWHYQELMAWFIQACWDSTAKHIAATILQEYLSLRNDAMPPVIVNIHATA